MRRLRAHYPAASVDDARRLARALGGDVDEAPPPWAGPDTNLFFGYDPEGNQLGLSRRV